MKHSENITTETVADGCVVTRPIARHGRARWAAIGAAVAVTVGAGGIMSASASIGSGERTVFVPITPCRLTDTRVAPETRGPRATPLKADETYTVQVVGTNGDCTIPADAVGVSLNVTAEAPTDASYLTVFPADAPKPLASKRAIRTSIRVAVRRWRWASINCDQVTDDVNPPMPRSTTFMSSLAISRAVTDSSPGAVTT